MTAKAVMDHNKRKKTKYSTFPIMHTHCLPIFDVKFMEELKTINCHIYSTNEPSFDVPVYDICTILFWYRSNSTTCWGMRKVRDGGKDKTSLSP
jgi:hypothetical protein